MIDFSPVGPEATAYPACIQSDVEVQDFYDYGHIEISQTPVQYKYTTKADVDDDEDFSDEYLFKQEDEEVREHSRFPSELRKPSDYTLNLGDHQYYSKIKTAEEIKQEELQLKRVLSRYQKLDTNMMDQVPVERRPAGRKPVHEANMENTNTKRDFSRERMIQSTPRLLSNLNIDTRNPPVKPDWQFQHQDEILRQYCDHLLRLLVVELHHHHHITREISTGNMIEGHLYYHIQ